MPCPAWRDRTPASRPLQTGRVRRGTSTPAGCNRGRRESRSTRRRLRVRTHRGGCARVGEYDRAALELVEAHAGAVGGPKRDRRNRRAGEVVGGAVVLWDGQVVGELQRILTTISSVRIAARGVAGPCTCSCGYDCMPSRDLTSKGQGAPALKLRAGSGSVSGTPALLLDGDHQIGHHPADEPAGHQQPTAAPQRTVVSHSSQRDQHVSAPPNTLDHASRRPDHAPSQQVAAIRSCRCRGFRCVGPTRSSPRIRPPSCVLSATICVAL